MEKLQGRGRAVRVFGAAAATLIAVMVAACVGGSKNISADDKERLKAYVRDTPPEQVPHAEAAVNFENKVQLLGYKAEPEIAAPGSEVKVTYYWKLNDTLDEGWKLFTHADWDPGGDGAGGAKWGNFDNAGPLREVKNDRQIMGPDRWEKGKVYLDEQTYKIPETVKAAEVHFLIGVWKGEARLHVVSGAQDGENRAIAAKLKTGVAPPPEEHSNLPVVTVTKLAAADKIVIDGKADDKAWGAAARTGPFVDVGTGKANTSFPVNGSARLAWDDTNMYVLFEVSDPDVVGYFTTPDAQKDAFTTTKQPKLWLKDTVEVMVDPDGNGDNKDYYEIQVNPQNKVFHTQYDDYNIPKVEPNGPFGHEDWDPKLKSAVVVKGTIDKKDDKDEGYTVEMAIPWAAFSKAANHPPKPGDTWRMNFYAMKENNGVAFSPILGKGNFHRASRFGKITWGLAAGAPAASGSAAASAAPSASAPPAASGAPAAGSGSAKPVKAPAKPAEPKKT